MHSKDGSTVGGDNPLLSLVGGLSGGGGYGTIGSVVLDVNAKKSKGHARSMSDASMASVTTDMAKSALFKGVTEHGTIQLQLPKDSFRVLMDSSLGKLTSSSCFGSPLFLCISIATWQHYCIANITLLHPYLSSQSLSSLFIVTKKTIQRGWLCLQTQISRRRRPILRRISYR